MYFIDNRNTKLEELFTKETKQEPVSFEPEYNYEFYIDQYTQ